MSGGGSFSAVHAGAAFTCALSTTGQAFCWGNNGAGNLGDGSTSQRTAPTAVAGGLTFLQLSLFADNHACGLTTSGDVYCWGYNFDGAVGDGTTTNRSVPTLVLGGRTYQAVASAHYHSCALDAAGAAWCWGDNNVGQIGDGGAPTDRLAPVQVQGGHTFTALKAGGAHTCGLTAGGQVYCWGVNSTGQLGNGGTTSSQAPVLVSGAGFTTISTGETHTCALAGGARCWGDNAAGQLGDGFTANQPAPVPVQNPPASVTIQAGNNQVAAPGAAVATPPAVLVRDALNNPLPGVEVVFAVSGGGGSIPGSTTITASNGIASVASWTLGATPGTNTLTATVSAGGVIGNPITFTATGSTSGLPLTWNGGTSADWNTAANWTPAQVPAPGDSVVIPVFSPNAPTLNGNATIGALVIRGTGSNLTVAGNLTVQRGIAIPDTNAFLDMTSGALAAGAVTLAGYQAFIDAPTAPVTVTGTTTLSGNRSFISARATGNSFGPVTISGSQPFLEIGGGTSGPVSVTGSGFWEAYGPVSVTGNPAFDVTGDASISTFGGAAAPITVNGDVILGGTDGRLVPGPTTGGWTINGNLVTTANGRLDMTQAGDTVRVNGNASFGGQDETGSLTAGALFVRGNLSQTGVATSFVGTGTHTVFLNGTGAQTVNFSSPGF
ncbi:MAG: hypothetical protein OEY41_18705, partial [Acidimicrobiia bacterium]|nr:hypothetical protein [Acidimicrobiia bacterium]